MPIPRRLIIIAASAVAAGAVLYVQNKMRKQREAAERRPAGGDAPAPSSSAASGAAAAGTGTAASSGGASATGTPAAATATPPGGAARELSLFLAGESWYDEIGWQGIWEREGVESPEQWLKSKGKEVLVAERKKLADHPALLAGCRRRWIVVCRYAAIDVTDAASVWNETEAATPSA